jgi:uncharacterized protein YndB with AHSA1/START domain
LKRWFSAPGWTAGVTNDFRVGGEYRIEMQDEAGQRHLQFGRYQLIEPIERLIFTWTCLELEVVDSIVTVELEDRGLLTKITLTHVLPADREIVRLHEEGWNRCLGQLERVLADTAQGETS